MHKTAFKYRILSLLRIKDVIFWMLIFPIGLICFFYLAVKDIPNNVKISEVSVAIVEREASPYFSLYDALSSGSDEYFSAIEATEEEALRLLESKKIDAIIYSDFDKENFRGSYSIYSKNAGMKEVLLKMMIDATNKYENAGYRLNGPMNYKSDGFIEEVPVSEKAKHINPWMVSVFGMLAMGALNAIRMGVEEVASQEANQSKDALRLAVSPLSKAKRFISFGSASLLLSLIFSVFVVIFPIFVLDIGMKEEFWRVLAIMLVGTTASYFIGSAMGQVFNISFKLKTVLSTVINLVLCGFAGMYSIDLKYQIDTYAPILNKINPAGLISDGLYSLYYFDSYEIYNSSIIGLAVAAVIFFAVTILFSRRHDYDSI